MAEKKIVGVDKGTPGGDEQATVTAHKEGDGIHVDSVETRPGSGEQKANPAEVHRTIAVDISSSDPLQMMSFLVREVDLKHMEMPAARRALADWFNALPDKSFAKTEGRPRARRLKQIVDSVFEEFWTVTSQV